MVEDIADAVTHARFVGTDHSSDGVVLMKILQVSIGSYTLSCFSFKENIDINFSLTINSTCDLILFLLLNTSAGCLSQCKY